MQEIHAGSRGTYGAPRIHAELVEAGVAVGRKRVARVMREAGIAGVSRRRGPRTTRREVQARPAPDRVERCFEAEAPNRLWVADIERHEALTNHAVMREHRRMPVAAGMSKLRAA